MKRLTTAVLLLAAVIGICIGSQWKLRQMTDEWISAVDRAAAFAVQEDTEHARISLFAVQEDWRESLPVLGALLPHDELDQIERLFETALQAAENRDKNEYLLQSAELRGRLLHLPERDAPKIQNIF